MPTVRRHRPSQWASKRRFSTVKVASRRGIRVGFNTNGTLLDRERAASLLAAGVDWLHVSVDGATAETFEAIRHGAHHDVVVEHLRGLLALRRELGRVRPFVQLNTVAMRGNLHELAALVRLAADLGVDRLWFQGLSHDFRDVEQDPDFLQIRSWTDRNLPDVDELRAATGEAARLAAELGLDVRFPADGDGDGEGDGAPRSAGEPGCDWPWRSAYVTYDGRVQACCMLMGRDRGVMGSIGDTPFGELWRGEPYRDLREQLTTDEPPDMCAGCAVYRRRF